MRAALVWSWCQESAPWLMMVIDLTWLDGDGTGVGEVTVGESSLAGYWTDSEHFPSPVCRSSSS